MDATADDWFDGGDGGGFSPDFSGVRDKASEWGNRMQERAKNFGRFVEKGAEKTGSVAGKAGVGNVDGVSAVQNSRNAEKSGGFANNVKGKTLEAAAAATVPGGKIVIKQLKKYSPFGLILAFILSIMFLFAGIQAGSAFGVVANGLDQFNNLRTMMNTRTPVFMKAQLNRGRRNHPIVSVFNPDRFKISGSISKKLAKQGVYYVDSPDYDCRFLVYKDTDTGKQYAVAASDADVGKLPSSVDIDIDGKSVHFDIDVKTDYGTSLKMSQPLSRSIDVGTRTLRGHIAGWFDDISKNLHDNRIFNSRNKTKDLDSTASKEDMKKTLNDARENAKKRGFSEEISETSDSDAATKEEGKVPDLDSDGKIRYDKNNQPIMKDHDPVPVDVSNDGIPKNASSSDIASAMEKKTSGVVAALGTSSDIYCAVVKAYSMFNILLAGVMVANVLNYITGFLEAVDKTKAGDAGETELSYYMTGLSQPGPTTDMNGNIIEGKENTSSLESPAWNQFFSSGNLVISPNDEVAKKFNRDNSLAVSLSAADSAFNNIFGNQELAGMKKAAFSGAGGMGAYQLCLMSQIGTATASLVVSFMMGPFSVIKDFLKNFWNKVKMNIIVAAIMITFNLLLPYFAQWMATDLISNMAGEDAAYAINSGFNMYLGKQMQASSGLPATEDKLMAHWRVQQEVIAQEGALEREMRSPFDITSKYTFLGSIVNSLTPIANTFSMPLTTISRTMDAVGSAVSNILPTARADGEVRFETSLNKNCPTLSQFGLIGDAYCNPYFVTDMSTMGVDPLDVFELVENDDDNFIYDNIDDAEHNGNPDIKPNSKLSKWVVACSVRDSQFGQVDSNVMNAIASVFNTGSGGLDTVIEMGTGMIPFVGDLEQIYATALEEANFDWATGKNCASDEYKYYSRYSEDQRLMESAGIIEESAVARFLDKYYEENPVDNSLEGTIARYSGFTKEEVAEALDVYEYVAWLSEYNPETYGPEKYIEKPDGSYQYESESVVADTEEAIVKNYIIFDDLRTKTKIA